ncbi:SsgA family sporulation/cell division regulator, partial [Actinacidiphila rubida]
MFPGGDGGPVRLNTVGLVDLLGESKACLPVDLVYDPSDPLAVTMVLGGYEGEEVRWTFGWDLLTA